MTWGEILDEMEQRIDAAELALDNNTALPVVSFTPPADIEPLPAELHERAVSVMRRQTEIEQRLENFKRAVAQDLGHATRATRAASAFSESATPSFIDSKA